MVIARPGPIGRLKAVTQGVDRTRRGSGDVLVYWGRNDPEDDGRMPCGPRLHRLLGLLDFSYHVENLPRCLLKR